MGREKAGTREGGSAPRHQRRGAEKILESSAGDVGPQLRQMVELIGKLGENCPVMGTSIFPITHPVLVLMRYYHSTPSNSFRGASTFIDEDIIMSNSEQEIMPGPLPLIGSFDFAFTDILEENFARILTPSDLTDYSHLRLRNT